MEFPWVRTEIVDPLTDTRQKVITLHSVRLPDGWAQGVPFGPVVPIGGSHCSAMGLVSYPVGYFAKPVSPVSPKAHSSALDNLIHTYGQQSSTAEEKLAAVGALAHALFDDYYGVEFVNQNIMPYLSAGTDTVEMLITAACRTELARLEIARDANSGPPA